MNNNTENRTAPVIAEARRQSDNGVLRASIQNATSERDTKRRKTLSGVLPGTEILEDSENHFAQEEEVVVSPPRKTPSKHRISLGAAHAYYFKSTSKTPFQKDTSFQDLNESPNQSSDDATANLAELSFLSLAGSTGSTSTGSDNLNRSVLSDTTELTASNFILSSTSRQRLAEFSKLAAEKKQKVKTVFSLPQEMSSRDELGESNLPKATIDIASPDRNVIDTLQSESITRDYVKLGIDSLSKDKKETIELRRSSMAAGSAFQYVPSPVATGRKSWHGTPGTIDVESSVLKYRELAATMKHVRLARDQQRQDEIKRRLSSQSNLSHATERSDLVSNTSFLSTPSEPSSSESWDGVDTGLSKKIDACDVESRSLDDLFEGLVPALASSTHSVDMDNVTTLEMRHSINEQRILDKNSAQDTIVGTTTPAFKQSSAQTVLTPTKVLESPRRIDNPLIMDSPARNTRLDANTLSQSETEHEATPTEYFPSSEPETSTRSPLKQTAAQKVLTPTKLSASPRRLVNPLSIDSPARNTRLASQRSLDISGTSQSSMESESMPSPSTELNKSPRRPFEETSAQKVLTPTKLSASPRRLANPLSSDSPARNTRLASQHRVDKNTVNQSTMETGTSPTRPSPSTELDASIRSPLKRSSVQKVLTPTKLSPVPRQVANPLSTNSPSRNTRSAQKSAVKSPPRQGEMKDKWSPARPRDFGSDVTPPRNNRADRYNDAVNDTMGSKQRQSTILNSSLRKQGSARKAGSVHRHVEFGSPEFAEFNKGSPSMNLTPMPAKALRVVDDLPEDTVEIEADMNALLNGVLPQSNFYLRSPAINSRAANAEFTQETACDMSLESLSASKEQETVQLEMNMDDLLNDRSVEQSKTSLSTHDMNASARELAFDIAENVTGFDESEAKDSTATKDYTASLEANISELLEVNSDVSDDKLDEISPPLAKRLVENNSEDEQEDAENGNQIMAEEDYTVELEMDMSALLMATAAETDFDLEDSMNASPRTARNLRRKSFSSRRFSLAPASRLSLSSDGHVFDSEDSSVDEIGSEASTDTNETSLTPAEITFSWSYIFSTLGIDLENPPSSTDFLEEVTNLLEDYEYGMTLNAVYSQVVDHVEDTTDPPLDLEAVVHPLDECNKANLCSLQKALKRGNAYEYEKKFATLAKCAQATELIKWTSWLVSVADTLTSPMKDLCKEISQKTHVIDDNCSWIQESLQILSSLEQRAAMRARKRNFSQRKLLVDALEVEVNALKEKHFNAKAIFNQTNDRYLRSIDATNEVAKNRALVERRDILQPRAEDLAQKYSYAKGIHRWKAPVISESELTFNYIGPTTDTCVVMTFTVFETKKVKCVAQAGNSSMEKYQERSRCLRIPLLTHFFKARTEALCNEWSGKVLLNSSEIREVLRRFQWQMGRLEQTAMELLALRRRHAAILTSSNDDVLRFNVEVDFSGMPSKLSARFELTADYPFAPLNVILDTFEGSVDIEKIRTLLIKNAKPGFGYLSRTCDVISAFMR